VKLEAQGLPERIAYWAFWSGDAVALNDGKASLTYAALDRVARCVAARVAAAGCGRGDMVLVQGSKRAALVAVLIGVMRAGAAYVPLQPGAPAERVLAMQVKTGARLVIVDDPADHAFPKGVSVLSVAEAIAALDGDPAASFASDAPVAVDAADPAYVLFTSGSTGLPNGAIIDHAAMTTFFAAVNIWMAVSARSRCLNTSALYFDVSIVDTMLPLYQGATVFLIPDRLLPQLLIATIEREKITSMCAVGSTLALVAQTPGFQDRRWPQMQSIMTGAEVLNPAAIRSWLTVCPDAHVFNGYGPTETTCGATIHPIHTGNMDVDEYPIGQPLPSFEVGLGGFGELLEAGDPAELLLRGPQVMRGYVGDPALTSEKLIAGTAGTHYRTGDLVRLEAGKLRFVGRSDDAVKVRGYRIHLGDVAHQFRATGEAVDAVAARLVHERHGECLAVAIETDGADISIEMLKTVASNRLPSYMQPRLYAVAPRFPRKASGKVDVGAVRAMMTAALLSMPEGLVPLALDLVHALEPVGTAELRP